MSLGIPKKRSRIKLSPQEYHALREKIFARDKHRCRACKATRNLHAHHIIFRSQQGDDADWNLLTLCNTCHDALHDRYILVLPVSCKLNERVDANLGVKLVFIAGWTPSKAKQK